MKQLCILTMLLGLNFFSKAQTLQKDTNNKSINLYGFAGVGRATIETDRSAPTKFPALEAKLGVGLSKSLNKNFELRSRIVLGNRFKRKPEINTATIVKYMRIEESATNQNHYFFEVPLLLQLNFPQAKLGLRAGGNYRQYFSSKTVDMFSGQSEFGIITGAYYQVREIAFKLFSIVLSWFLFALHQKHTPKLGLRLICNSGLHPELINIIPLSGYVP